MAPEGHEPIDPGRLGPAARHHRPLPPRDPLPDGNGVELYWDRPRDEWPEPQPGQKVEMYTRPLDLRGLLAELDG